jgi:hypothetical protein
METAMPNYDVFIYRDFSDHFNVPVGIGTEAGMLGLGDDLHVVAIGRGVNEGKDGTLVLAHGSVPMSRVQALLDSLEPPQ